MEHRLAPDDQVIIITHEPVWLLEWYWGNTARDHAPFLRQLVRGHLRGRARMHLAGDLHFYMRHSFRQRAHVPAQTPDADVAAGMQPRSHASAARVSHGSVQGQQQQGVAAGVATGKPPKPPLPSAPSRSQLQPQAASTSAHAGPVAGVITNSASAPSTTIGSIRPVSHPEVPSTCSSSIASSSDATGMLDARCRRHGRVHGAANCNSSSLSSSSGDESSDLKVGASPVGGGSSSDSAETWRSDREAAGSWPAHKPTTLDAPETLPRQQSLPHGLEPLRGGLGPQQVAAAAAAGSISPGQHYTHHPPPQLQMQGLGGRSMDAYGGGTAAHVHPGLGMQTVHAGAMGHVPCLSCRLRAEAAQHPLDPDHLICNGGGGAFLHPTHVFAASRFVCPADPAAEATARLYSAALQPCTCRVYRAEDAAGGLWGLGPGWGGTYGSALGSSSGTSNTISQPGGMAAHGSTISLAAHASAGAGGVAGGSGGAMYAASIGPDGEYACEACYPDVARSVALGRKNLHLFRLRNTR